MTCIGLVPWQCLVRSASIVAALLGMIASQSAAVQGVKDTAKVAGLPAAPPLPEGCPRNRPPSTATELNACLKGLEFEDSIEALGDQQRLMINPPCPGSCEYGPLGTIQPEKHSHLYNYAELKEGRIIARLFLSPEDRTGYAKLGLVPKDTTYWWVQKTSDNEKNAGTSVFITAVEGRIRAVKRTLRYTEHPEGSFKQAVARWLWDPTDETTQGSCGHGCCH